MKKHLGMARNSMEILLTVIEIYGIICLNKTYRLTNKPKFNIYVSEELRCQII